MVRSRKLKMASIWDEPTLLEELNELYVKQPEILAAKIHKHLLTTEGITDLTSVATIQDMPKGVSEMVVSKFTLMTTTVVEAVTSGDNAVTKLVIQLQDGLKVETVIIRHGAVTAHNPHGEKRTTLCVSSQVGCKMGCTFCATGTMGEIGDLCAGEILEQLIHARQWAEVSNIVFMGMGEPFNNYKQVVSAVNCMIDGRRFKIAPKRVTVSTVGVIPKIYAFIEDLPMCNLALSLHAPVQEQRMTIVPSAKAFKLPALMEAMDEYIKRTRRTVLIEYVLLAGINDDVETAHNLGKLLQPRKDNVTINLIPYNTTNVSDPYKPPAYPTIQAYIDIVMGEYGCYATVRKEMGGDIAGACGQLVVSKEEQKSAPVTTLVVDLEDMMGKAPKKTSGAAKFGGENAPHQSGAIWPTNQTNKKKQKRTAGVPEKRKESLLVTKNASGGVCKALTAVLVGVASVGLGVALYGGGEL
ncbi:hypothetical protein SARC_06458 [Sphaeroforma arctica JP610]|uniref:Radical SAM core domain-containing protein n=1 Tax=Sphaeroforma arctica JP610 TaxID=667725 RepID=A0A0L0FXD3_9EUKA|nr:hypothetical protein SARC_06458 [Sphaeroforma arctica JP610]KNC81211.1 hypothetical protein SARC_06458 [Sphaeroforma arctica JP610]|eukprot:XP_014155113.1 hypothetical protein SARC_06458 [Sphaeroforma arctica JP610]